MSTNQAWEVTDIEDVIKKWAKEEYNDDTNCWRRVWNSDLELKVDWSGVTFEGDTSYKEKKRPWPCGKPLVLYRAQYANRTNAEQEYSLHATRTTKSSCTVELTKTVTTGSEVRSTLKTPLDIVEVNGGFKREIAIQTAGRFVTEEELSWSQDTVIKVPAKTLTTAVLTVREQEFKSSFTVKNYMYGRVVVNLYNKKKGHNFIGKVQRDVVKALETKKVLLNGFDFSNPGIVSYITEGKCSFQYGIQQNVELSEGPLPDDDGLTNGQEDAADESSQ